MKRERLEDECVFDGQVGALMTLQTLGRLLTRCSVLTCRVFKSSLRV